MEPLHEKRFTLLHAIGTFETAAGVFSGLVFPYYEMGSLVNFLEEQFGSKLQVVRDK